mgnify:CR=1 FL=1
MGLRSMWKRRRRSKRILIFRIIKALLQIAEKKTDSIRFSRKTGGNSWFMSFILQLPKLVQLGIVEAERTSYSRPVNRKPPDLRKKGERVRGGKAVSIIPDTLSFFFISYLASSVFIYG